MGVALDRTRAALNLMFEFADAAPELMVELALCEQLLGLPVQRAFSRSKLLG